MKERGGYRKNIALSYLFTFVCSLDLTRGIWMIYLASKGFSLLQLGILESVFHVTSLVMEVPTGIIADLWGRKVSRALGRLSFFISLVLMFSSSTMFYQLVGFIFCALGYNLESGAGEALLYDSLKAEGEYSSFMRVNGRKTLIYQGAAVIAYLVGGYLATRSFSWAFIASMVICTISGIIALLFAEPPVDEKDTHDILENGIAAAIGKQLNESLQVIIRRPRIAMLILFSELIFTCLVCLFFYLQNYWKQSGFTEFDIGIIYACSAIISGLIASRASRIEARIGEKGVLLLMPLLLVVFLWGVALTDYSHLFYIATGIIEGVLIIAISDYVNRMIPSLYRATILSFHSMCFSVAMIIVFPLFGAVADGYSMKTAFILLACIASIGYLLYLVFGRAFRSDSSRG